MCYHSKNKNKIRNKQTEEHAINLTWQISGERLRWFLQSGQSCFLAHWKCGRYVQYTWLPKLMQRGACQAQRGSVCSLNLIYSDFNRLKQNNRCWLWGGWSETRLEEHTCKICWWAAVWLCPDRWDRRSRCSRWDTGLSLPDQKTELQSLH